nr:alpha/beta hydrolase [Candidatus Sigynarchaeota archaeon]
MSQSTHRWKRLPRKAKVGIIIFAFLGGGLLGFVIWAETPNPPMVEALQALISDAQVIVSTDPYITFTPAGVNATTGFIIYPGGRVDPRSYAPAARDVAAAGYLVIITSMPLNLAVFGINKAGEAIASHPQVLTWAVGGHSLGGVMAAQYASSAPASVAGIVFWASYPANNMSTTSLHVLSISGTEDGLSTPAKINASHASLPASTTYVAIAGGNHGQFGWYGDQPGDNSATISRVAQQAAIVGATTTFLASLQL